MASLFPYSWPFLCNDILDMLSIAIKKHYFVYDILDILSNPIKNILYVIFLCFFQFQSKNLILFMIFLIFCPFQWNYGMVDWLFTELVVVLWSGVNCRSFLLRFSWSFMLFIYQHNTERCYSQRFALYIYIYIYK